MSQTGAPPLLAVVGLAGAGKSEVAEFVTSMWAYTVVYFGGVIVSEVARRGLEVTSENERLVREDLRSRDGMDVVARRSLPTIVALRSEKHNVVIDGLYSTVELLLLKRVLGENLVTLAIHAPRWLRKQRLGQRSQRSLTPEEVDARDRFEIETLDKAAPIALADLHVVNDSSLRDLHTAVLRAIAGLPR